jgi:phenylacetate-CoA ligase
MVGDFATLNYSRCVCGRTLARARGGFVGRADDMLNVRGQKLFPSVIEEVVRGFEVLADEFQIVLETEGVMDTFTIVAESRDQIRGNESARVCELIESEIIRQCELRPRVRLVDPGTLPKTEFKARRVIDRRHTL